VSAVTIAAGKLPEINKNNTKIGPTTQVATKAISRSAAQVLLNSCMQPVYPSNPIEHSPVEGL